MLGDEVAQAVLSGQAVLLVLSRSFAAPGRIEFHRPDIGDPGRMAGEKRERAMEFVEVLRCERRVLAAI